MPAILPYGGPPRLSFPGRAEPNADQADQSFQRVRGERIDRLYGNDLLRLCGAGFRRWFTHAHSDDRPPDQYRNLDSHQYAHFDAHQHVDEHAHPDIHLDAYLHTDARSHADFYFPDRSDAAVRSNSDLHVPD